MTQVKVKKEFLGLKPGTILTYNEKSNTYDYIKDESEVSKDKRIERYESISLSKDTVDFNDIIFESYEEESGSLLLLEEEFDYIKPVAVKAYRVKVPGGIEFEGNKYQMTTEDYVIKGLDGSLIPISKNVFDKLFKIIQ